MNIVHTQLGVLWKTCEATTWSDKTVFGQQKMLINLEKQVATLSDLGEKLRSCASDVPEEINNAVKELGIGGSANIQNIINELQNAQALLTHNQESRAKLEVEMNNLKGEYLTKKYAKEDVLKSNLYSYYNTTAALKRAFEATKILDAKRDKEIDDTNKEIERRRKEMDAQEKSDEETRKKNQERIAADGVKFFEELEVFLKEAQGQVQKEKKANREELKKTEAQRQETQKERQKKWYAADKSYRDTNNHLLTSAANLETQAERNYNTPTERKYRHRSSGKWWWRKTWQEPYTCDAKQ